jgi:hypothetical protein
MDYNQGYKDALDLFEASINRAITKERSYTSAMNEIVSTLYVAKLQYEIMEDKYIEHLEEQQKQHMLFEELFLDNVLFGDNNLCDGCEYFDECESIAKEEF